MEPVTFGQPSGAGGAEKKSFATATLSPKFLFMFKAADLFDLGQTEHAALFEGCDFAWEALGKLAAYIAATARPGLHNVCEGVAYIGKNVSIGEGTVVEDGVMIKGPAIIGRNCHLRHNAYLRENVILGDGCVVGNSTELKNALLFNKAGAPHFNYIGDSILGHKAHLGAGVILSNVRSLPGNVTVEREGRPFDTGLRKFGSLVGDGAEVGCNAVLNPGSIIGRGAVVYPGVNWRGILPSNMIAKNKAAQEVVVRRPRET
jgi:NDP-sugar pyrophosphorylase family protein